MNKKIKYLVAPNPKDKKLTQEIGGFDENFKKIKTKVIIEKDLTIYLNNQEIVTLMTVGDHPKYLAVGYLLNQNMLKINDQIKKVDYDPELKVVIVRTLRKTNPDVGEKVIAFAITDEIPRNLTIFCFFVCFFSFMGCALTLSN